MIHILCPLGLNISEEILISKNLAMLLDSESQTTQSQDKMLIKAPLGKAIIAGDQRWAKSTTVLPPSFTCPEATWSHQGTAERWPVHELLRWQGSLTCTSWVLFHFVFSPLLRSVVSATSHKFRPFQSTVLRSHAALLTHHHPEPSTGTISCTQAWSSCSEPNAPCFL